MPAKTVKVMIVEDDPFLLRMYAEKFEMENFAVVTVDDGRKGLRAAMKEMPDIILLDIMLPGKSGFDVLVELKAEENLKNIPVILLTNLSQREDVDKGLKIGATDYLIKAHFMPSEVVEKVKNILSKSN